MTCLPSNSTGVNARSWPDEDVRLGTLPRPVDFFKRFTKRYILFPFTIEFLETSFLEKFLRNKQVSVCDAKIKSFFAVYFWFQFVYIYNSGPLLAPRPVSVDQKSKGFSLEISNCKNTSNYKKTVYQISRFSLHWHSFKERANYNSKISNIKSGWAY